MWILILTITTWTYGGSNAAVSTVHGFTSEKACMVAAESWLTQKVARREYSLKQALCAKA